MENEIRKAGNFVEQDINGKFEYQETQDVLRSTLVFSKYRYSFTEMI